jgi:hypothetical protein
MSKTRLAAARSVARMTDATQTTVTIPFEITGWDEQAYDTPADGPPLAMTTVRKRFDGALSGTSVARVLTAQGEGGAGYVASERVEGTLEGRTGTFVLQHAAVGDADGAEQYGHVVPGSATGDLAGLRGTCLYAHDDDGARVTLTYRF